METYYSTMTTPYGTEYVTLGQLYLFFNMSDIGSNTSSDLANYTERVSVPTSYTSSSNVTRTINKSVGVFESKLIIPLYVVIFLLAVVGNSMVVITLAQNKRMRTVTNVYLLNLVS